MTKTDVTFDPDGYAPVAERIRLFYVAHPGGRIETELVRRTDHDVVFKALVYRTPTDDRPAATGWACEREGDGEINAVACLENTETSAIGRALANLGFTASRQRPSAEEMAKASRRRARLTLRTGRRDPSELSRRASWRQVSEVRDALASYDGGDRSPRADATLDALRLLDVAERAGFDATRAASLRVRLRDGASMPSIERLERSLRHWLQQRPGGGESSPVKDSTLLM